MQPALVGIAHCQHHVAGVDRGAVLGEGAHAACGGSERVQHRAVMHLAAAPAHSLQQPIGQAIGIDPRRLAREQGTAGVHVEALPQCLRAQPAGIQADSAPCLTFGHQARHVAMAAGQVQAVHALEINVFQAASHVAQGRNRLGTRPIGKRGGVLAMALRQFQQMGIDLVLQQRGAGSGAAPADIALLDHCHVVAMPGQFVGNQRTGDAATDHQHVAAQVLFQWRKRLDQSIAYRPPGVTALQVHSRVLLRRWDGRYGGSGSVRTDRSPAGGPPPDNGPAR